MRTLNVDLSSGGAPVVCNVLVGVAGIVMQKSISVNNLQSQWSYIHSCVCKEPPFNFSGARNIDSHESRINVKNTQCRFNNTILVQRGFLPWIKSYRYNHEGRTLTSCSLSVANALRVRCHYTRRRQPNRNQSAICILLREAPEKKANKR
jgi:hypothetical protein